MSEKRTDFEGLAAGLEEKDCAWVKSEDRVGSLGRVRVSEVRGEVKPWNWAVRSSSWRWRGPRASDIARAALSFY